jgi:lysophospholipase L1-like esterase
MIFFGFFDRRIKIEFSFKVFHLLFTIVSLLFFSYVAWEVYWYSVSGLAFIKWHTHIVFTAILFGIILLPILLIFLRVSEPLSKNIAITFIAIWVAFIISEVFLIVSGINKDYLEERSGYYKSPFDYDEKNYYYTFHKNQKVNIAATEFSYAISYNSLGYTGAEWNEKIDNSKLRIITLGDSFTEGDGAPIDSSYPKLMGNILGDKYEVLNAGLRGSDPAFGIKNLEDRLLKYKPDIVIQSVSENDLLFDFCIRGGYERFINDSILQFNKPPWWEPFYAMSYTLRSFLNIFDIDMKVPCGDVKNISTVKKRNSQLKDILNRFDKLAKENSIKVIIMIYPTKFEVLRGTYDFDYAEIIAYVKQLSNVEVIDLFPCYKRHIENTSGNSSDFYWIIDGHHNSKGYQMMAQCALGEISEIINE